MKVRLLRSVATAEKVYAAGAEVWVADALAERWQAEGIAVAVEGAAKHRQGPPATKAVEGPSEAKGDQGQEPEQPADEASEVSEPVEGPVEAKADKLSPFAVLASLKKKAGDPGN